LASKEKSVRIDTKKIVKSNGKEVKRQEKRHISLRRWSKEACNSSRTTLMQGITKIGTQRSMKNHIMALHELTTHIPKKSTEGDICRPPSYILLLGGLALRP
jgi:hypothetical protein